MTEAAQSPIREGGNIALMPMLYQAIALARVEFLTIEKKRVGKVEGEAKGSGKAYSFQYLYADLSDILPAIEGGLARHGIAVLPIPTIIGNRMILTIRLAHLSGCWLEGDYPVVGIGENMRHQQVGAAMTYARRNLLTAMLNLAAEDAQEETSEESVTDSGGNWPASQQAPRQANSGPPRPRPAQGGGNLTPSPTQSTGGEAASSTGATTHTTSEATKATETQAKPSLIDVNDPLIIDVRKHMENSDQLRRWHKENKEKIDAKGEEWTNEFYPRYDASMAQLMAKEKEAAPAATVQ